MGFKPPAGFNDFPDQHSPEGYMSSDTATEWLMQPSVGGSHPELDTLELKEIIGALVDSLDDVDREMIHLIFYEQCTFSQAAKACGLRAKSYAWRKANRALTAISIGLRSNPRAMEILSERYGNLNG